MPTNAVSAHWPRQYVAHSNATVLALHPYRDVEQLLPALYTLDERPCLPCTVAVVLDQMMPHALPQTLHAPEPSRRLVSAPASR